ncbi:MAG: GH1 family beta-glucosidase [Isosphaeraceae bacterium]|nr:GH1 family beta-glucosidase [Isosphaeraceae bacterium]
MTPDTERGPRFPEGFVWGVAVAAPQIEGSSFVDGKSASIWDRFAETPGRIKNGDRLDPACDHYRRWRSDFELLRELGIEHYRFSVAWPRVIPDGDGSIDVAALDHYSRQVDALLELGITPWVTLFHWDLPQVLEDRGGWPNRLVVDAFRRYADAVVERLGDRVKRWFTLNEIPCIVGNGYENGYFAPGRREPAAVVNQAYHHALLAHGHAMEAIREHAPGSLAGLVHNHLPAPPIPVCETEEQIDAARIEYARTNDQLMGPLFLGRYPDAWLERAGADAPRVEPGDLERIGRPMDFLGLNVYAGDFVRRGADGRPERLPFPKQFPQGDLWWLNVTPQSMYWSVRLAREVYGATTFYMTESGACFADRVDERGEILDLDRREYVRNYLLSVHRAIDEGFDIRGYFLWSFLDNFEWAEGYEKRFGIVHVDFETQARTPKLSARWYSEVIRTNRLV